MSSAYSTSRRGHTPVRAAGLPDVAAIEASQRFSVIRRIGSGGMGIVYEARDRERDAVVAVKVLRESQSESLARFKDEFRRFQDLQHPNLIALHELFAVERGPWFFTMELVRGVNFLDFVRGPGRQGSVSADETTVPGAPAEAPVAVHQARLRSALGQLAQGLCALHEAGIIHRDLKPSNIRISEEGRLVILDFGLAVEMARPRQLEREGVVGTVEYMAPEQAASKPVTAAADWYAAGIMLFQALTGQLPLEGAPLDVLMRKQREEPPPPSTLAADVPPDLDHLCRELLRFEPGERPSGHRVLAMLGVEDRPAAGTSVHSHSQSPIFVGREATLAELSASFRRVAPNRPQVVYVWGESGIGKTALAWRFVQEQRENGVLVLEGRCYERESVPYKAVDGIVDRLAAFLAQLPKANAAMLLPRHVHLLAEVFPVLNRIEAVADAPRLELPIYEPSERRHRLFAAFRELMVRTTDCHPALLSIDDLQWADSDSLALLAEVLRGPDAPRLMILATVRPPGLRESEAELVARLEEALRAESRHIALAPLAVPEAQQLAALLLRRVGLSHLPTETIARESHGHPLFIDELVRMEQGQGAAPTVRGLEDALWARISALPVGARDVVELINVAGTPVPQGLAAHAAGQDYGAFVRHVALLRVANLVRTAGTRQTDTIEPYHDRIRATVRSNLDEEQRKRWHRRLAVSLETATVLDLEALARHWRGAGDDANACRFYLRAADRAATSLAFDRAARLYERHLELAPDDKAAHEVRLKLAEALASGGRGGAAAAAYLDAAARVPGSEALDLRRRAAEHYLRSGHVEEGLAILRPVLAAYGIPYASTPSRALVGLLGTRMRVGMRGHRYRARNVSQVTPEQLARIDLCWSVGAGLANTDTIRASDFQARSLLLALRAGEPYRIARALATEAGFVSTQGGKARKRTLAILTLARSLASTADEPRLTGLLDVSEGIAAFQVGEWKLAAELLGRAETLLRERCRDVDWEVTTAQVFRLYSLFFLGQVPELVRSLPDAISQAEARGDRNATTNLRLNHLNHAWLVADDVEQARREAARAMVGLPSHDYLAQHWYQLMSEVSIELYRGDARAAWERLDRDRRNLKKSLFLRIQFIRLDQAFLVGRTSLAMGWAVDPAHFGRAAAQAAQMEREDMPWSNALSRLLRAGCAHGMGRPGASELLAEAEHALLDLDMTLFAKIAMLRRGQVDGDQTVISEAQRWLEQQGVRSWSRFADMILPWGPAGRGA